MQCALRNAPSEVWGSTCKNHRNYRLRRDTPHGTGTVSSITSVQVRFWHQICDKSIPFSEALGRELDWTWVPHFLCRGLKVKSLTFMQAEREEGPWPLGLLPLEQVRPLKALLRRPGHWAPAARGRPGSAWRGAWAGDAGEECAFC